MFTSLVISIMKLSAVVVKRAAANRDEKLLELKRELIEADSTPEDIARYKETAAQPVVYTIPIREAELRMILSNPDSAIRLIESDLPSAWVGAK